MTQYLSSSPITAFDISEKRATLWGLSSCPVPLWRLCVATKHFTSVAAFFFLWKYAFLPQTVLQPYCGVCDNSTSFSELCRLSMLTLHCSPFVLGEQTSCYPFLCLTLAFPKPSLHFSTVPRVCLKAASERCLRV